MPKHVALYVRVSTDQEMADSQVQDLGRWAEEAGGPVVWYRDVSSGRTMDRPGWNRMMAAVEAGDVSRIVCTNLDRCGRSHDALSATLRNLGSRGVGLISIRDGFDLSKPDALLGLWARGHAPSASAPGSGAS